MIIHNCEQGTDEWHLLRAGIPTASEYSKLITSTGSASKQLVEYATQLAADAYAGKPLDRFEGNGYTERGKELESMARDWYSLTTDNEVTEVGFCTDDDGTYGASPDGLVGEDGAVEFKCLIAKNHVKALLYYQKHGRCPTDYVPQTQGQLFVCERQWNDLVFFHPDLPCLVIRQTQDTTLAAALQAQLAEVIRKRDDILSAIRTV